MAKSMSMDEAVAIWTAEALDKISTQDVGSSVVVLVEGERVAAFLTWASLVRKSDATTAAEMYAATLRRGYVALAKGTQLSTDGAALDVIAKMLRDPSWGVGMLEDIAELVTATGRSLDNPNGDSTWDRH